MTAKRLTFYTAHTLSRHAGHILLSAHVTADIPFVDFIYENHLDGVEREGDMPCGYFARVMGRELTLLFFDLRDRAYSLFFRCRWNSNEFLRIRVDLIFNSCCGRDFNCDETECFDGPLDPS